MAPAAIITICYWLFYALIKIKMPSDSIASRSDVERDTNDGPTHLGVIEDDGPEGQIFTMMSDDADEDEKAGATREVSNLST